MKKLLPISATVIMLLAVACGGSRENYTPSYTSGQSVVNIHFTEYDSVNNGYIEAFLNGYDGLGEIPPTKVNNDGSVSLTFDLNGDAVLRLMNSVTGDNIGAIRIAPGETTDVTIFPDSLSTTGKYAQLNSVM